jgi:hypothetical protein
LQVFGERIGRSHVLLWLGCESLHSSPDHADAVGNRGRLATPSLARTCERETATLLGADQLLVYRPVCPSASSTSTSASQRVRAKSHC